MEPTQGQFWALCVRPVVVLWQPVHNELHKMDPEYVVVEIGESRKQGYITMCRALQLARREDPEQNALALDENLAGCFHFGVTDQEATE